jgi:hypothetical protein
LPALPAGISTVCRRVLADLAASNFRFSRPLGSIILIVLIFHRCILSLATADLYRSASS